MNADVFFPSQLHWSSQELAEAVPLRLHELFAFAAIAHGPADGPGNDPCPRTAQHSYTPGNATALFRIR